MSTVGMGALDGRVALVTGAGSGIGQGIARRFAAEGATVVVNDVTIDSAKRTTEELGAPAHPVAADVSDRGQVDAMYDEIDDAKIVRSSKKFVQLFGT